MKRGPKPRPTAPHVVAVPSGLGACPETLVGAGRALWVDAVKHLEATGQAHTVYRHGLLLACEALSSALDGGALGGISRVETCRRWLRELGLTPASGQVGAAKETSAHEHAATGRAKILALIDRQKAGA